MTLDTRLPPRVRRLLKVHSKGSFALDVSDSWKRCEIVSEIYGFFHEYHGRDTRCCYLACSIGSM